MFFFVESTVTACTSILTLPDAHAVSRGRGTVRAGTGFLSQSSKWLHFGLGSGAPEVRLVRVRWPGGNSETFVGIENKRRHRLTEGAGNAEQIGRAHV